MQKMEFCFWDFLRNIRKKTSLSSAGSHHQTAVHTDLKNAKNAIRMDGVFYLIYGSLPLLPTTPSYGIRLLVGRYPFETDETPKIQVDLDLPATQDRLFDVLEECEKAASWEEMVFEVTDSAIPALFERMDCEEIWRLNELAACFKHCEERGELPKLKAVILAADCHDAAAAVGFAKNLDDYLYQPDQRTAEEAAIGKLCTIADEASLPILAKHINLWQYGAEVMKEANLRWAKETFIPPDQDHNSQFCVESHPAVLDGFVSDFRALTQQEQNQMDFSMEMR